MTRRTRNLPGRSVSLVALVVAMVGAVLVTFTAPAAAASFANAATITVPDASCAGTPGQATPYPSNIAVSGLAGTVTDVNVTLNSITSDYAGDLEVLLVAPTGQTLVLLSDAGQGPTSPLNNTTLVFDDAATSTLPQNAVLGPPNATVTAKPTNYPELAPDTFPAPAPAPSASTTLAAFNGIVPNGTWRLYVIDDGCGDAADTIAGWSLDITTAAAAPTSTSVTSAPNPSTTGQNVTFTATVTSGGSPVTAGTVTFTEGVTVLAANVALNAGGQASFATSTLPEGNHVITATYNGTASFATSNGSVNQRVDNATTVSGTTYCNTGPITINASAPATPYPSNISVTGAPTTISKVTVTLKNVTHTFPDDIDALLVGPGGQNLTLVSDAGNPGGPSGSGASNVTAVFDDAAAGQLPQNAPWGAPGSTVSSRPVDHEPSGAADVFPAPAPTPSAATTLETFEVANPNGTWSLYVVSDGAPDTGSIAGGWCLTLTAALATPPMSTAATQSVTLGNPISDHATLVGAPSVPAPTGTVTFTLFGPLDVTCAGVPVFDSGPRPLAAGSPATADSGPFIPTAAGTYRWIAAYSGDANYTPVTGMCNAANETSVVNQATPTITTSATPTATLGGPISDTATVAGPAPAPAPTGTVTFTLFGPNDTVCAGSPIFTSPARALAVGPPATATSTDFTPTAAGTYRWIAVYSGDANYGSVTSPCNAANETSVVNQATPTITTSATTPVTLGAPISDTATVTGAASPAPAPTGTVTFTLFGPDDATCAAPAVFNSGPRPLAPGPPPTANSGQFTPTPAGTYRWIAVYSGDANYGSVTSPCNAANETSVVTQATAGITTSATPSVTIGSPISDTATVVGAPAPTPAPTGTVTFTLFGPGNLTCTGAPIFTSPPQPLGGSPRTASSGPFTPTASGLYNWVAVYSGDVNYAPATSPCGAAGETSVVNQAGPSLTTTASAGGPLGAEVTDTATLSGGFNPTGSITFSLYGPDNADCSEAPRYTQTLPVNGNGTYTTTPFAPPAPGLYRWVASYSGDLNNAPATSPCNAPNESVTIGPATPTIATQASPAVVVGGLVRDVATIAGGFNPTGTIEFRLYGPDDATCATPAVFVTALTVAGNGAYTSEPFTTAAAGTYRWTAAYSGDANNNGALSPCNAANESVVVTRASPSITTQASAPAAVGGTVTDTATVSGGFNPMGTVTFRLFSDPACTAEVFTSTNPLNGGTATSGAATPAAPGTYFWTAVYSGDVNNDPATSACGAPNESVTIVKASPTIATQASPGNLLGAPVRDVATLAGGFGPTGTVTFRLFNDDTCATEVFTSTNPVAGSSATSDWFTPAAVGTYFWTAAYSGDANNNPATSACQAPNESVTIAPFAPPTPTRTITGDLMGPVVVGNGESVLITNARVVGPVTVQPGGALTVVNSQISRGITADAPSFFSLCGAQISGPSPATAVSVTNAPVPIRIGDPATGCAGNRIAGQVSLTSNVAVTFGANIVPHNATIDNNGPGNTVIKANRVFGTLGCAGNNPAPSNAGQVNTAGAKTGQCAAL